MMLALQVSESFWIPKKDEEGQQIDGAAWPNGGVHISHGG